MSAFLPALTVWVPICYNSKIVIWPGHDGDILSGGMSKDSIVDRNIDVYIGYRCCILRGICEIDFCSDSERRLGCVKDFQATNLRRESCHVAARDG